MKSVTRILATAGCVVVLGGATARAGGILTAMRDDGGHGVDINLIVREVRVAPVRAHVGDKIRVDMVIESHGDGNGTIPVRIYANGKSVASHLFTFDSVYGPNALYRESFVWDTRGARPGEYNIRAEAFNWNDTSPFDNEMTVKEPVSLLPTGTAYPPGQTGGGEAVAVDPRWHPKPADAGGGSRNPGGGSGVSGQTAGGRLQ